MTFKKIKLVSFIVGSTFLIVISFFFIINFLGAKNSKKEDLKNSEMSENNKKAEMKEESNFLKETPTKDKKIDEMTLEEKVAQLFIIEPEDLTEVESVTDVDEELRNGFIQFPVGGVILFGRNIDDFQQTREMNQNLQELSREVVGVPLLISIDEEGGEVARIANNSNFDVPTFETMNIIGSSKSVDEAHKVGSKIGSYLKELNFNLNFAPVVDVKSKDGESFIEKRSFGSDPVLVGEMGSAVIKGFHSQNIKTAVKHFPGLGSTFGDTHYGEDVNLKSRKELRTCDFIPFTKSIEAGTDFVMVCGVSVPSITGDDTPAVLSKEVVTETLKKELGYSGLIITDAMNMGAIVDVRSSEKATIEAFEAGVDMILMPENFERSYFALIDSIKSGDISEERLDESVNKILKLKEGL